jgi:hypothetical protein
MMFGGVSSYHSFCVRREGEARLQPCAIVASLCGERSPVKKQALTTKTTPPCNTWKLCEVEWLIKASTIMLNQNVTSKTQFHNLTGTCTLAFGQRATLLGKAEL